MRRKSFLGLAFLGMALAAGCGAPPATTTPVPGADTPTDIIQSLDIASHSGQSFEDFTKSAGMEGFALDKLDLAPDERARLAHDMAVSQPSRLISGGGGQALVFTGCARAGCQTGLAVLAFGDHGETFVGVRDAQGGEQFIADDRMEALLRLSSASRRWDDPDTLRPAAGVVSP